MTPEKLDELEPWVDWPTISRADLLDLIATARREAALREALGWAIDGLVELVNTGWSSLAERHAQEVIDRARRALLSEVPQ